MTAQWLPDTEQESPSARPATAVIALLGNPNTGKSSLFTALTGTRQKIANYPGVTVEAKLGSMRFENTEFTLVDLPGTYSLEAHSPDERVAIEALLGRLQETPRPDGVIFVADASSLDRNLYLATQVLEFGLPTVIALTMVDVARARGIEIDCDKLSRAIGAPVIPIYAPKGEGLSRLKATLSAQLTRSHRPLQLDYPEDFLRGVQALHTKLVGLEGKLGFTPTKPEALRLLVNAEGPFYREAEAVGGEAFGREFESLSVQACGDKPASLIEAQVRYGAISRWMRESRTQEKLEGRTLTDRVDSILTHRVWGMLVFILVMGVLFQSIYAGARPLMNLVEFAVDSLGSWVGSHLAEGPLRGLIVQGVIGGAGGVLGFLPQILMLFLFIAVLEDLGYMSRAAFLMDRLMSRFGLTGRSFIPLLNSFACAVPAIMGTRVIEDRNTRLTTIFLAPFMSCSARLPVYTVMIGAFVPRQSVLGVLSLQGLVLFAMYGVGVIFAIPTGLILRRIILKSKSAPFLLELPSYKLPRPRAILLTLVERGGAFVKRAGTIILAVSVLVWAASYFPRQDLAAKYAAPRTAAHGEFVAQRSSIARAYRPALPADSLLQERDFAAALAAVEELGARFDGEREEGDQALDRTTRAKAQADAVLRHEFGDALFTAAGAYRAAERTRDEKLSDVDSQEAGEHLRSSFMGRAGRFVEPMVLPLGWDWRIAMAAIASFPAREVIIATLGTIFNLGETDAKSAPLREVLRRAEREDGTKLFSLATGLSIMVFFALCCQCAATLAVMRRETNSWRWPAAAFLYMTTLAYVVATATYQVAHALGA